MVSWINSIIKVASYLNKSFTLTSIPRPSLLLALRLKSHLKKGNYFERFAISMDTNNRHYCIVFLVFVLYWFKFALPSLLLVRCPLFRKTTASLPRTTTSPLIPTCRTLIHHHHPRCRTACCRTVCCQCKEGCCSLLRRLLHDWRDLQDHQGDRHHRRLHHLLRFHKGFHKQACSSSHAFVAAPWICNMIVGQKKEKKTWTGTDWQFSLGTCPHCCLGTWFSIDDWNPRLELAALILKTDFIQWKLSIIISSN